MDNLTFNPSVIFLPIAAEINEAVILPFWGMVEELIELIFGDGDE